MHLSSAAWVILIIFVVFIVALNLNLIFAFRKKHHGGDWVDKIQKANQSAANPWKEEDENYERLSNKVKEIKSSNPPTDQKTSE